MLWSQGLIPTFKQAPAEAQTAGYALMLRAGMVRAGGAGVVQWLHLGWRVLGRLERMVRARLERAGGSEVSLPLLQPGEMWEKSGLDAAGGEELFRLRDRRGRELVLPAGFELAAAELGGALLRSYKQLPVVLYQIQTRMADEPRPRGGLMRLRESVAADVFAFCADEAGVERVFSQLLETCAEIVRLCALDVVSVDAEPAGKALFAAVDAGEDMYAVSDRGNYAATLDAAAIGERAWGFAGAPAGELERVHTPNLPSIDAVAAFLRVPPGQFLKTLVFQTNFAGRAAPNVNEPAWVVAVVRGDHDVNEAKLTRAALRQFNIRSLKLVDNAEVRRHWAIGFVGPDAAYRNPLAVVLVDPDAAQAGPWVAGANAADYHVRGFNWFRECGEKLADPTKTAVADLRTAGAGDPSPMNDGGRLALQRGIELAWAVRLGDRVTRPLDAMFIDETGQSRPILMAAATIHLPRIIAAVAEVSRDERGILWPTNLAPFDVILTPIKYEGESRTVADRLHEELAAAGFAALLDDRDLRAGAKFADADLVGAPVRVNIGERTLKEGKVEVKSRRMATAEAIGLADVASRVRTMLSATGS